jgi:acetyltransferase
MLARLTQVDYDRELALLALQPLPATSTGTDGGERMLGVARYSPNPDRDSCEFALAIGDAMQGHGIGHLLMTRLMQAAREAGYRRMNGSVLRVNDRMLTLGRTLGFRMRYEADDPTQVQLDIELDAP